MRYDDKAVNARVAADKKEHIQKSSGHVKQTVSARDKSKRATPKANDMDQAAVNVYLQRRGVVPGSKVR